jgi:hypothetical protein
LALVAPLVTGTPDLVARPISDRIESRERVLLDDHDAGCARATRAT